MRSKHTSNNMKKVIGTERREKILNLLVEDKFAAVDILAEKFNVSPATVRRDLIELESGGHLERVHGGAFFFGHPGINRILTLSQREVRFLKEKERIGRKAASLVRDGETVILDGGTTTYQVAKNLINKNLQIITNSLPIANLFENSMDTELLLIGGILYPKRGVFLGPVAQEIMKRINADKAFIGVGGIVEEGITNTDMLAVELQKDIIGNAREVIVVADQSKWDKKDTFWVEELSKVDKIVSDKKPYGSSLKRALRSNEVEIIVTP